MTTRAMPAMIGTKLHLPAPRRQLVARTRLTGRLPGRSDAMPRLVLIAAPAGFGKTTLMTQWLSQQQARGCRIGWVSLDAQDSDLRRLLTLIATALQRSGTADRTPGRRNGM